MIGTLQRAIVAFTRGEIGERELIAISLAVNGMIPETIEDDRVRAVYQSFAKRADEKLLDRAAELA